MINRLIALTGKSASGKTTLAKMLTENFRYDKVITYTTRPMRDNETNGVDYFFVTEEEFYDMVQNDRFVEYQEYKVDKETWRYGTEKNELYNHRDAVIIVEVFGLLELKKMDLPMISFYIKMDDKERWKRQIDRGDDILEVALREVRDKTAFGNIEKEVDYVVYNNATEDDLLQDVLRIIAQHEG